MSAVVNNGISAENILSQVIEYTASSDLGGSGVGDVGGVDAGTGGVDVVAQPRGIPPISKDNVSRITILSRRIIHLSVLSVHRGSTLH